MSNKQFHFLCGNLYLCASVATHSLILAVMAICHFSISRGSDD
jgi:hypothetical protein